MGLLMYSEKDKVFITARLLGGNPEVADSVDDC